MEQHYQELGPYSDLVSAINKTQPLYPVALPGDETQKHVRQCLAFSPHEAMAHDVRVDARWEHDGVAGEALSWSVGYGPRTESFLLRPAMVKEPLPAVVALHDHGGFKYFGKEKVANGPEGTPAVMEQFRELYYGGRAFANALAREGFVVLIHDVFLWGSRKFPITSMSPFDREIAEKVGRFFPYAGSTDEIDGYNAAAVLHENTVAKYCMAMGTTLPGIVNFEDRVAVDYLSKRADVRHDRIGCIGLSGGGIRSALLQATESRIAASVVIGMMSTYQLMLDHNISSHTWMLYPAKWAQHGDWPDIAACRAPSPLMVQYDEDDGLFTTEGMRSADLRLREHYTFVGASENYSGHFYPGPHKFDLEMQADAFAWLGQHLTTA